MSTASLTTVAGQTASSRTALGTNCPAWAVSTPSTAQAFGVTRTAVPCRQTHALGQSIQMEASPGWGASVGIGSLPAPAARAENSEITLRQICEVPEDFPCPPGL